MITSLPLVILLFNLGGGRSRAGVDFNTLIQLHLIQSVGSLAIDAK
jgi:hypothetical protein